MKACPGKHLKMAALRSIEICDRNDREHLTVSCHTSIDAIGSLISWSCVCGCASIWDCGQDATAQSCLLMYSMGKIDDAMKLLRMQSCVGLLMPCMRNSMYSKSTGWQYTYLLDRIALLEDDSTVAQDELWTHLDAELKQQGL